MELKRLVKLTKSFLSVNGIHDTKIKLSTLEREIRWHYRHVTHFNASWNPKRSQITRIPPPYPCVTLPCLTCRLPNSFAFEGVEGEKFAGRVTPRLCFAPGPEKSLILNPRGRWNKSLAPKIEGEKGAFRGSRLVARGMKVSA